MKRQSLYFCSPKNFNDPYDCAITASIAEPTHEGLDKLREHYLALPETQGKMGNMLSNFTEEQLLCSILKAGKISVDQARDKFMLENGVTCFTESNDNFLMWSHYGGQHCGFCLEFRTDCEPFNTLRRVKYVDVMPKIDLVELIADGNPDQVVDLFCTKSKAWEYEQEWRAIHTTAGTVYTYDPKALKAIYFGTECALQDIDLICCIMHAQNPEVELYTGSRSNAEFRVEFSPAIYRPPAKK
ncbi:MAG: DUF2971 domain-containing protein [Victivallales bacterium]|nr:DUF2971 domain-containing protein [Victivallales bacterium]